MTAEGVETRGGFSLRLKGLETPCLQVLVNRLADDGADVGVVLPGDCSEVSEHRARHSNHGATIFHAAKTALLIDVCLVIRGGL